MASQSGPNHSERLRRPMAMNIDSKKCSCCNQDLPLASFSRASGYRDGYRGQCRGCRSAYSREYARTPGGVQTKRRYRSANIDKVREADSRAQRKKKYGLTDADYSDLFARQEGRCALCRTDKPKGRFNVFHVDHCHETGRVRGLLCHRCNVALGALGDTPQSIAAALAYVEGRCRHA